MASVRAAHRVGGMARSEPPPGPWHIPSKSCSGKLSARTEARVTPQYSEYTRFLVSYSTNRFRKRDRRFTKRNRIGQQWRPA